MYTEYELFTNYYNDNHINEDETFRTCNTNEGDEISRSAWGKDLGERSRGKCEDDIKMGVK